MARHKKHWVAIKDALPNFAIFGWHLRKIMVKSKGKMYWTQYLGWGEFGNFHKRIEITHWLCDVKGCGSVKC